MICRSVSIVWQLYCDTPSPAVDKSTHKYDLLLGGSLVSSDQLQNHKVIFFVSIYTMSFDRWCPSWAITILQLVFIYLIINPLSSGRKHPSTYPQTLWDCYRSLTFPEVSLEFCTTLSLWTDMHSCQNSFWGSYWNWFGDGHIEHPLTLPALSVHLTALFLFVTTAASKKIMDLLHKALYELVVLLELERLGPY